MTVRILRLIGAVVAGIVVATILVVGVEALSAVVHPFPDGFDGSNEELAAHVARYPAWFLALAVPMWGFAALSGTWTAGRLGNRGCALFVGILLLASTLFNISLLPYPVWFAVLAPATIVAAIWLGDRLSRRREEARELVAA